MNDKNPGPNPPDTPESEPIIILSAAESAQLRAPAAPPSPARTGRPRPATPAAASRRVLDVLLVAAGAAAIFAGGAWLMPFWVAADARLPDPAAARTKRIAPPPTPGRQAAPPFEPPLPQGETPPAPRPPEAPKPAETASVLPPGRPGSFRARVTIQGPAVRREATIRIRAAWNGDRYRLAADGESSDLDRVRLLLAFGPAPGAPRRDDELRAEGGGVAVRLFEQGAGRTWELLHPSRAIVRREAADWRRRVTAVGREALDAGGRRIDCVRLEGEDEFAGGRRRFRMWFSPEFPFGALRAEQASTDVTVLVDVLDFTVER